MARPRQKTQGALKCSYPIRYINVYTKKGIWLILISDSLRKQLQYSCGEFSKKVK